LHIGGAWPTGGSVAFGDHYRAAGISDGWSLAFPASQ
jgi:hypothetical protein